MKYYKTFILIFINFSVFSQVVLDNKVVLSASDSTNRKVTGISFPESSASAANSGSLLNGQLIYGIATGINLLSINLQPAVSQYTQGMVINFKTSSPNTGPVAIQLNGLASVPLKKNGSLQIDSLDFAADQMVTAIFDGTAFQVISKLNRRCPAGFVDVNKDFCIELVERDTVTWFTATKICGDLNGRLCSQSEWAFACENSAILNLVNMNDNMEWVDSAANSSNNCKTMGVDQFGYNGCNGGVTQICTVNRSYRCCYSK